MARGVLAINPSVATTEISHRHPAATAVIPIRAFAPASLPTDRPAATMPNVTRPPVRLTLQEPCAAALPIARHRAGSAVLMAHVFARVRMTSSFADSADASRVRAAMPTATAAPMLASPRSQVARFAAPVPATARSVAPAAKAACSARGGRPRVRATTLAVASTIRSSPLPAAMAATPTPGSATTSFPSAARDVPRTCNARAQARAARMDAAASSIAARRGAPAPRTACASVPRERRPLVMRACSRTGRTVTPTERGSARAGAACHGIEMLTGMGMATRRRFATPVEPLDRSRPTALSCLATIAATEPIQKQYGS
jgi:hypothetical protein